MKEMLTELCTTTAVGGGNKKMCDVISKYLLGIADVHLDHNGNIYAEFGNKNGKKSIILDAHIDQIGLVVTSVLDNGFLRVAKCGGVDTRVLQGSPVTVHGTRDVIGIVCCMPPHLSDNKEDTAISVENILIDTGLSTEEANQIISLGDSITCDSQAKMLINDNFTASALDNRAGVAAVIRAAQLIGNKNTDYKITALFSSQEETYGSGAKTGAFQSDADEAIVVDVSFAVQPGSESYPTAGKLGEGTMICISPTLNRDMTDTLFDIAKKSDIPYQTEVCSGRTGTNADHISITKSGVKTALLSVPQRNMHTQAEIVNLNDIESTAKLIAEYVLQGGVCNG